MDSGGTSRPGHKMVTFLEPQCQNAEEPESLCHVDEPTPDPAADERQQKEDPDHLLAFREDRSNHPRPRSHSASVCVQPPRIADSSFNEHLNRPEWEVQK